MAEDPEVPRTGHSDMMDRLSAVDAAKARDKLPPRKADTEEVTQDRLAKAGEEIEEFVTDTGKRTMRMLDGSVLDMLFSRKVLSGNQYAAGCQLYTDWYDAGFAISGVIDPAKDVVDGGKIMSVNEYALDAATRYHRAMNRLDANLRDPLMCLVLLEESLTDYGRRRFGTADRKDARLKAITALQISLSSLDLGYYKPKQHSTQSVHAADYRPTISPRD